MSISYEGIGQVVATFQVKEGTGQGVVTMVEYDTVGTGVSGNLPCGVLMGEAKNGMGAVQVEGLVTVRYSGLAPSLGYATLTCDGEGGVIEAGSGRDFLVVSVDESTQTLVMKL